jgi:hypothetical protein
MTSKTFEELNGEGVSGKCERMRLHVTTIYVRAVVQTALQRGV